MAVTVHGLAMCEYRPKRWDVLKSFLQETTIFNSTTLKHIMILKTAAALCVLDVYKPALLEKALQQDFLQHALSRGLYKTFLPFFFAIFAVMKRTNCITTCF